VVATGNVVEDLEAIRVRLRFQERTSTNTIYVMGLFRGLRLHHVLRSSASQKKSLTLPMIC